MTTNARAKYEVTAEDKTKKALGGVKKNFEGVSGAVKAFGAVGLGALGVAGLGGAITKFGLDSAKSLDEVAKAARRLGVTVEELDAMTFAAELAGSSGKDLETAWKRGARNIADAAEGIGDGKKALDAMGLSATDAEGRIKSVNSILLEMADRLPDIAGETQKVAIAQQLFGRSGTNLLPLLRQGRDAIHQQMIEAHSLGIRTSELSQKGEDLVDAQLRLNRSWRTAKDVVAGQLMPTLSHLAETMANKLVGLVTGLDKEFRDFLATAALEGPEVQIELLNTALRGTEEEIAAVKQRAEGLNELMRQQANAGRTLSAGYVAANKKNNEELDGIRRKQAAILDQIETAKASMERQAEIAQELNRARAITAQRLLDAATLENEREESLVRQKILQEDINRALKESRDVLLDLSAPEFDIKWLPKPKEVEETIERYEVLKEAIAGIADTIGNDVGNAMEDFVRTGQIGGQIFGRIWRNAMAQLLGDLSTAIAKAAVLGGLRAIGVPLPSFGGGGGGGGGGPVAKAAGGVDNFGAGDVILVNQSLLPGSTEEFVRADIAVQEANFRRQRFAIA